MLPDKGVAANRKIELEQPVGAHRQPREASAHPRPAWAAKRARVGEQELIIPRVETGHAQRNLQGGMQGKREAKAVTRQQNGTAKSQDTDQVQRGIQTPTPGKRARGENSPSGSGCAKTPDISQGEKKQGAPKGPGSRAPPVEGQNICSSETPWPGNKHKPSGSREGKGRAGQESRGREDAGHELSREAAGEPTRRKGRHACKNISTGARDRSG